MFVGKSPLRISFAGGGTDLEEYHNKFEGCTISFTIDLSTWITAKKRKDSLIQGFSPDFSSYIPPTKHKNLIDPVLKQCENRLNTDPDDLRGGMGDIFVKLAIIKDS